MSLRPFLPFIALMLLATDPCRGAVPSSKAGVPGSKGTAEAGARARILSLQSLDGISKADRQAAFEEYVLAFRAAAATGDESGARELAEKASLLWPDRARPWLHLAAARLRLRQWSPAIEAARRAVEARPDEDSPATLPEEMHAAAGYWEGLALYRTQRLEEALPRLRAAHAALPTWAEGARGLAEAEFVANHMREAAAAYDAAFALDPDVLSAQDLSYLSEARAAGGDVGAGVAAIQEALHRAPYEPGLHAKLGDLLRREGHASEAYYELVEELLLHGVESRFAQPALAMSQEIVKTVRASKDDPNKPELLAVSAGLQHLDAGQTHQALHHLTLTLQLTRSASPVPRLLFVDALRRDNRTEEARTELQKLLATDPDLVPALFALSEIETKLGHPREAEVALTRVKEVFPEYWKLKLKAGS